MSLHAVAQELAVPPAEVEALLVTLILDGKVDGVIDQPAGLLVITPPPPQAALYAGLEAWAGALQSLHAATVARVGGQH